MKTLQFVPLIHSPVTDDGLLRNRLGLCYNTTLPGMYFQVSCRLDLLLCLFVGEQLIGSSDNDNDLVVHEVERFTQSTAWNTYKVSQFHT